MHISCGFTWKVCFKVYMIHINIKFRWKFGQQLISIIANDS